MSENSFLRNRRVKRTPFPSGWRFEEILKFIETLPISKVNKNGYLVARAKEQAPKPKRAGIKPSRHPPVFSAKRRGGKRRLS
jgi:hypothetical protein